MFLSLPPSLDIYPQVRRKKIINLKKKGKHQSVPGGPTTDPRTTHLQPEHLEVNSSREPSRNHPPGTIHQARHSSGGSRSILVLPSAWPCSTKLTVQLAALHSIRTRLPGSQVLKTLCFPAQQVALTSFRVRMPDPRVAPDSSLLPPPLPDTSGSTWLLFFLRASLHLFFLRAPPAGHGFPI